MSTIVLWLIVSQLTLDPGLIQMLNVLLFALLPPSRVDVLWRFMTYTLGGVLLPLEHMAAGNPAKVQSSAQPVPITLEEHPFRIKEGAIMQRKGRDEPRAVLQHYIFLPAQINAPQAFRGSTMTKHFRRSFFFLITWLVRAVLCACTATQPAVRHTPTHQLLLQLLVQQPSEGSLYFSTGMSEDYTVPRLFH